MSVSRIRMMRTIWVWKTTVDDTDPENPKIMRMRSVIRRYAQCLPLADDLLIEILGFASGTMAFWCQLKQVSKRFSTEPTNIQASADDIRL